MPPSQQPENDTQKEISQMIGFIMAEAHEKMQEIRQKAQSEYQVQFQELKREAEQRVQQEYKSKYDEDRVQRLIAASHKKQAAQASLIELRSRLADDVRLNVIKKLDKIESHPDYSKFLLNLIVQGLLRVQEERIAIRCRKIDEPLITKILKDAEKTFIKAVADSTGYTPKLHPLKIDTDNYLPPPYVNDQTDYCLGGVEIVARHGKIVCKNTLDERLELAFTGLLPHIRSFLFGEKVRASDAAAAAGNPESATAKA